MPRAPPAPYTPHAKGHSVGAMPKTTPSGTPCPARGQGGWRSGNGFLQSQAPPPTLLPLLALRPPLGTAHPSAVTSWQGQWAIHHLMKPEATQPGRWAGTHPGGTPSPMLMVGFQAPTPAREQGAGPAEEGFPRSPKAVPRGSHFLWWESTKEAIGGRGVTRLKGHVGPADGLTSGGHQGGALGKKTESFISQLPPAK